MDDKRNDVVTVKLIGADLELLRAGQAQGEAAGIRSAVDGMKSALKLWKDEAIRLDPEFGDVVEPVVTSFDTVFGALVSQAEARTIEGRAALQRAVAAGAGKPRASVGLRRSASKAMMWAARMLEGS